MEDNQCLTVSLEEAARQLGIGRALSYRLASRNKFPGMLRLGCKIRVSTIVLQKVLTEGWIPPVEES